jgi:hypothetical protein
MKRPLAHFSEEALMHGIAALSARISASTEGAPDLAARRDLIASEIAHRRSLAPA